MEATMQEYVNKTKFKVNKEDYRFGIITRKGFSNRETGRKTIKSIGICNCGQHNIGDSYNPQFTCENCGNDFFIQSTETYNKRFVIPYLEAEYRTEHGFKIKRCNLSVIYTGEEVLPVQENLTRTLEFDMVKGVLKVWRNDELEYDASGYVSNPTGRIEDTVNHIASVFFTKLPHEVFWEFISTDVTRGIYKVAKTLSQRYGTSNKPFVGLLKLALPQNRYLQILANAGITEVNRFYANNNYYKNAIDKEATKPHKILKMPKFMIQFIREDTSIDLSLVYELQQAFKDKDMNLLREIISIAKDEASMKDLSNSIENMMELHNAHGYTNLKKLSLYLFREVRMSQGIGKGREASNLLVDYVRMSKELGAEWEKYPKSLKREHDLATLNYQTIKKDARSMKHFDEKVNSPAYQSLVRFNDREDYVILAPERPEDLLLEGQELSHCVGSYVKSINEGRCMILFMRKKNDIASPFVTIEVRGRNIRQAKGRANRSTSPQQREYIQKWAEDNGLNESYY